jgi:hypothetical protein
MLSVSAVVSIKKLGGIIYGTPLVHLLRILQIVYNKFVKRKKFEINWRLSPPSRTQIRVSILAMT